MRISFLSIDEPLPLSSSLSLSFSLPLRVNQANVSLLFQVVVGSMEKVSSESDIIYVYIYIYVDGCIYTGWMNELSVIPRVSQFLLPVTATIRRGVMAIIGRRGQQHVKRGKDEVSECSPLVAL